MVLGPNREFSLLDFSLFPRQFGCLYGKTVSDLVRGQKGVRERRGRGKTLLLGLHWGCSGQSAWGLAVLRLAADTGLSSLLLDLIQNISRNNNEGGGNGSRK